MEEIRILLVIENKDLRHRLDRMLHNEEDMCVIGDCGSIEEALSHIEEVIPNIIILETQLLDMKGAEAARRLRYVMGDDGGIILLAESLNDVFDNLEDNTVDYYLDQSKQSTELVQVIRQVYQNRHYLPTNRVFLEEEVELIIGQCFSSSQISTFISQLHDRIRENHFGRVWRTVGSNKGVVITINTRPNRFADVLRLLNDMPDVESVDVETKAEGIFPHVIKKIINKEKSTETSIKKIYGTLKQSSDVCHELATALN